MKRYLIIIAILIGIVGCQTYKNVPYVSYWNNEMNEIMGPMKDYCIYDYVSPLKGRMDNVIHLPAHYHILLPPKRDMRKFIGCDDSRCFIYTKSRGIAILQGIHRGTKPANGFRQIPADSVRKYLSVFDNQVRIKVKEQKNHHLYVDHEIKMIFFNLSEEDYPCFVELPLKSLEVRRREKIKESPRQVFDSYDTRRTNHREVFD